MKQIRSFSVGVLHIPCVAAPFLSYTVFQRIDSGWNRIVMPAFAKEGTCGMYYVRTSVNVKRAITPNSGKIELFGKSSFDESYPFQGNGECCEM